MSAYSTYSDQELADLLKLGDGNAFSEIFERYADVLISFAYRNLYDKDEAKDLVQDIFVDIWLRHAVINITKDFRSFIFSAVKNRIFDQYKHRKVAQRYLDNFRTDFQTATDITDHLIRHNDLNALIEKEIEALPPKMRDVFDLSRKAGMTRKEIAAELNLPEATVRTNMNRALKILKDKLGPLMVFVFLIDP